MKGSIYDMEIGTWEDVKIIISKPERVIFDELETPMTENSSEGKNVRWGNNRKKISKTIKRIRQKIATKSQRINRK